jgi:anti-anti-sigma factor
MPVEKWSDEIAVARLADDPQLSDDLHQVSRLLDRDLAAAVLDFSTVRFVNSTNLGTLLELRKKVTAGGKRLILCGVGTSVWGTFLVTGLDKVFTYADDVPTALASLQLSAG